MQSEFQPYERAARHPIVSDKPAMRFFEGALLGNGGLGVVVTERPDAIEITLGHNNVWDVRLDERHAAEIGTFAEVFAKVRAIDPSLTTLDDDPWYAAYCRTMADDYDSPYPRPFPCGRIVFGFDRRDVEVLGHELEVANGLCRIALLAGDDRVTVRIFVDQTADLIWMETVDADGNPATGPFNRIRVLPETIASPPAGTAPGDRGALPFPRYTVPDELAADDTLAFHQLLPASTNTGAEQIQREENRAFRVTLRASVSLGQHDRPGVFGPRVAMGPLERAVPAGPAFVACIRLDEGLATAVPATAGEPPAADTDGFAAAWLRSEQTWRAYWDRSGVALDDEDLERLWYHNLYFLNCAIAPGVQTPGLWANWSYREIGTKWHGDYHMNYNTQQTFWVTFSSNHLDKHLPYVDLVERLLPESRRWASDYYGLRGACFPHSAYPLENTVPPYPVPTWGWEICETPWTVQSLWWHYQYGGDVDFLRERAFGPIAEAVRFLLDYARRPEASGLDWGDDHLHLFPSVVPELYGLTPGLRHNADILVDLTLTRFVLNAYVSACEVLGLDVAAEPMLDEARELLDRLPPNPTSESERFGTVFVSVANEDPEIVYNVPIPAMPVFPGEEIGLGSEPALLQVAVNSYRNQRNEGGNELVFSHLQGARLGVLDLEKFKRQVRYCLLPNGTCTDLALQSLGRYSDQTRFDFMGDMGIWLENFALPIVANECLLQSHDGTLRLFPNWPLGQAAAFRTLRAVGAFLVSAGCAGGTVQEVEVTSEAGGSLHLVNPWHGLVLCRSPAGERRLDGAVLTVETEPGETLTFRPTDGRAAGTSR